MHHQSPHLRHLLYASKLQVIEVISQPCSLPRCVGSMVGIFSQSRGDHRIVKGGLLALPQVTKS